MPPVLSTVQPHAILNMRVKFDASRWAFQHSGHISSSMVSQRFVLHSMQSGPVRRSGTSEPTGSSEPPDCVSGFVFKHRVGGHSS